MSGLALVALVLLGGGTAGETATPDFSGRWVLNKEQSDDPREKMRDGRGMGRPGGERGPRGGGIGRPGGGGMGGGMGGRRPPRDGDAAAGRRGDDRGAAMRATLEAAPELTITHTAREIAILEKDGRLRALHPDGAKYKNASGAEVKTRWDKDRLVVQTAQERGPGFTETWGMTGDPAQIVVLLRFEPPNGEEVTLKRVYDRARDAE